MAKQSFWIDTDTASDDAVALVMALRSDVAQIEGISIVAGNVSLEKCVQNALYTVELCGASTPVYVGLPKPIMRKLEDASEVHGQDGMGDIGLKLTGRTPEEKHAIDAMTECIMASPGKIRLVTLGPLSNIAAALLRTPEIAVAVEHCYIMGGTPEMPGNVNEVAEFNIWADPEAAHIVVESGMPMTFVGWDVSMASAFITDEHAAEIKAIGTPFADFTIDIQGFIREFIMKHMGVVGFDLPDPLAVAVALDPSIAETKEYFMRVVVGDGITRGQTVVDHMGVTGNPPNVNFATHIEPEVFRDMLKGLLK